MSEKFVDTPIEPHSSRRDIADRINRAFSTSDITAICQRLRGVQPSVASSDDHKIALNVRSGSKGEIPGWPAHVCFSPDCVAKLLLRRLANRDSVGRGGIGGSGA
jgi:hypothetical protein